MTLIDYHPLFGWLPTVRDSEQKRLHVTGVRGGPVQQRKQVLSAGETIALGTLPFRLDELPSAQDADPPHVDLRPGKYGGSQA